MRRRFQHGQTTVSGVLGTTAIVVAVSAALPLTPVRRAGAECEALAVYGEVLLLRAGLHRNSSGCGQRRCWGCGCALLRPCRVPPWWCSGSALLRAGSRLAGSGGKQPRLAALQLAATPPLCSGCASLRAVRPRCAGLAVCWLVCCCCVGYWCAGRSRRGVRQLTILSHFRGGIHFGSASDARPWRGVSGASRLVVGGFVRRMDGSISRGKVLSDSRTTTDHPLVCRSGAHSCGDAHHNCICAIGEARAGRMCKRCRSRAQNRLYAKASSRPTSW